MKWEVVRYNILLKGKYNDHTGLKVFDFTLFDVFGRLIEKIFGGLPIY